jgi:hypothetical protein
MEAVVFEEESTIMSFESCKDLIIMNETRGAQDGWKHTSHCLAGACMLI